jgi:hypothetical protein
MHKMRSIRNLAALFFGMALGAFIATSALAETMPPTGGGSGHTYTGQGCYSSPSAACAAVSGTFNQPFCDNIPGGWPSRMGLGSCNMPASCPSTGGWVLQGSVCFRPDCVPPAVRQENGSCALPVCPEGQTRGDSGTGECKTQCAASGSAGGQTGEQYQASSTAPGSMCGTDGCSYKPTDCVGVNSKNYCWLGKSTGNSCNSSARNANGSDHQTPEEQAAEKTTADQNACLAQGKCPITINGSVTCGQCGSANSNTDNTTTNPNGTTQTGTSTNCTLNGNDVTCTTTTTTTTTPSGGGTPTTSTTTGTTSGTKASYCAENPAAQICRGQTDCEQDPDRASCQELGTAPENPDLLTQEIGVSSVTPVFVNGAAATCPADIPLPKGMAFEWDGICMFVEGLRPVILALAWLAAGFILLGFARDD